MGIDLTPKDGEEFGLSNTGLCQCCICKKPILETNPLGPCGLTIFSNCNQELEDQKEQTFYCHIECFKNMYNDPSTFYLESLYTGKDFDEENKAISSAISAFAELLLSELSINQQLSSKLFGISKGSWTKISDVIENNEKLSMALSNTEERTYEPLIVTWLDDFHESTRFRKKSRCVAIAMECHYSNPEIFIVTKW